MAYSDGNSYNEILVRALNNSRLSELDKREGSVIYDTLAPLCLELSDLYIKLDILQEQSYLLTATGINLDRRCNDYGIVRENATKSQRIGVFKKYKRDENNVIVVDENGNKVLEDMSIPLNSRFIVPENNSIIFRYIKDSDGQHILECETAGAIGNSYLGAILPITPIYNLVQAKIVNTYIYGQDTESDDELRLRAREHINYQSYGGNIPDYRERISNIDGVGRLKVFPAWEENGSVLLSVVSSDFNVISASFIEFLKSIIDPEINSGRGYGIAPIGHRVTVTTPVESVVDVEMTVVVNSNTTLGAVDNLIEEAINNYFNVIRADFGKTNDYILSIYISKIIDVVMDVEGVENVSNVLLNGANDDIIYIDEAVIGGQYLPKVGDIIVHGN